VDVQPEESEVLALPIPVSGFVRAMGNILWSSLRHPFELTAIDLSTGQVIDEHSAHG
jgi:hypothetical protein